MFARFQTAGEVSGSDLRKAGCVQVGNSVEILFWSGCLDSKENAAPPKDAGQSAGYPPENHLPRVWPQASGGPVKRDK